MNRQRHRTYSHSPEICVQGSKYLLGGLVKTTDDFFRRRDSRVNTGPSADRIQADEPLIMHVPISDFLIVPVTLAKSFGEFGEFKAFNPEPFSNAITVSL